MQSYIKSTHNSNLCLDVENKTFDNGNTVKLKDCDSAIEWYVDESGEVRIIAYTKYYVNNADKKLKK